MMKPNKFLLTFVLLIVGTFVFHLFQSAQSEEFNKSDIKPPEKVWTRMDTLVHAYDSIVGKELADAGTVGAALVLVYNGEVVLIRCYGEKLKGSGDLIDKNTVFRLASVSKTFTGTLAAKLANEDLLPLNSKVKDYIPGFRLKDPMSTTDMQIAHLLSHTTGLVPYAYDNLVESGWDMKTIMDSLFRVDINGPPGTYYSYQNVAFSLYDTISEIATGKSFEALMKEEIFSPLGMKDASVGLHGFINSQNKALPHVGGNGKFRATKENLRYYNTNPAAGVNASISDLSRFLIAMTGHNRMHMDTSVIHEVITPRINSPLRRNYLRKWNYVGKKEYALGWRIIGSYNSKIAYHGGYVDGYRAEIAFSPEEDFGIALLSNSPNGVESGIIPLFLDLYFNSIRN